MEHVDDKEQKKGKKLALFLILGPGLGIIGAILLYAIINFIISSFSGGDVSGAQSSELYGDNNIFKTIANVLLFLIGAVSVASFFPCLIVGIILLSRRNRDEGHRDEASERTWKDLH